MRTSRDRQLSGSGAGSRGSSGPSATSSGASTGSGAGSTSATRAAGSCRRKKGALRVFRLLSYRFYMVETPAAYSARNWNCS